MSSRWAILAVLFAVRFTMAFQFQSIAAVAPFLRSQFNIELAEIGFLIGLYSPLGIVFALPGGAIGKIFGDKRTVLVALSLMLAGELATAFGDSWNWHVVGRLVAGAGGVLLNVQLTKMIADWFAGREIATAMAIFVNSWPAGVACALIVLPLVTSSFGITQAYLTVCTLIVAAIGLIVSYRSPPKATTPAAASSGRLDRRTTAAIIVAGLLWGLFNIGLATVFSFGPSLLVERGWTISQAGTAISIVLWLGIISAPLGGLLADRFKLSQMMLVLGCILSAGITVVLAHTTQALPSVIALGMTIGLAPGAIMSLPARVLGPATRAIGMGLFYTLYYLAMTFGPIVGGASAKWHGSATAALDFAALAFAICPLLLLLFRWISSPDPTLSDESPRDLMQGAQKA